MYFNRIIALNSTVSNRIRKFSSDISKVKWEAVIGLEVHAQLQTKSKLFSGAGSSFFETVNDQVSFFDAAIPGTLPVLNKECVKKGVLSALALNCTINSISSFDRKHYFYADLPAGFQITQQRAPFATNGFLEFEVYSQAKPTSGYLKRSTIKQIQLEQDSGKSLHDAKDDVSLVDLNRAGNPLIEIVFEPDLSSGEEAACLVQELILILRKIDTCSCKIQEGALRVDANVSIKPIDSEELGIRSEIKNIGGLKNIADAVDYEISRHKRLRKMGKNVINETRFWDAENKCTVPMRDKEMEQDYRFMPEPNLLPLRLTVSKTDTDCNEINITSLRQLLPQLPSDIRKNLKEKYNLSTNIVIRLLREPNLVNLFISLMCEDESRDSVKVSNFLLMDLKASLNKNNVCLEESSITTLEIGQIYDLLQKGIINRPMLSQILGIFVTGCKDTPIEVVEKERLFQIDARQVLEESVKLMIECNPDMVKAYFKSKKSKKDQHFQKLFTEALKITENRANLLLLKEILQNALDKLEIP